MSIAELVKVETVRRLEEGLGRIHACVGLLTDEQVWQRPNNNVVSIGNLILHLSGNVRQWVIAALGGEKDERMRHLEFSETGPMDRVQLMGMIDRTIQQAKITIDDLDEAKLLAIHPVQVYEESGVGILIHVAEHFSYHVGQISLHTKLILNVDLGYYEGLDLEVKK